MAKHLLDVLHTTKVTLHQAQLNITYPNTFLSETSSELAYEYIDLLFAILNTGKWQNSLKGDIGFL